MVMIIPSKKNITSVFHEILKIISQIHETIYIYRLNKQKTASITCGLQLLKI